MAKWHATPSDIAPLPSPLQLAVSAAPSTSHCSPACPFTLASPQRASVQSALHADDSPPSSHSSPAVRFTLRSPHLNVVQSELQTRDSNRLQTDRGLIRASVAPSEA